MLRSEIKHLASAGSTQEVGETLAFQPLVSWKTIPSCFYLIFVCETGGVFLEQCHIYDNGKGRRYARAWEQELKIAVAS